MISKAIKVETAYTQSNPSRHSSSVKNNHKSRYILTRYMALGNLALLVAQVNIFGRAINQIEAIHSANHLQLLTQRLDLVISDQQIFTQRSNVLKMWGRLLVLACAGWEVWSAITTNSALFVSGPAYKNIFPRGLQKYYLISKKEMISKSFILPLRQQAPSDLTGSFFYERFAGRRASPSTCFSTCFSHGGCHSCGRPNCWGDRCQHCANRCWETPANTSGETFLWGRGKRNVFSVVCDGGWQLLWRARKSLPRNTPPNSLRLKLKLVYEGDVHVASYFASVYVKDKRLSVGAYLGGEAGNWWKAPFNDRKLAYNTSLNCLPFFNPSSHCEANNIMSQEEQQRLNNRVVTRGYAWLTGTEYYDNLKLIRIEMWMRCVECPDMKD
ncbi:uncharacterized protein [Panulirus ornatus]|uniref:uncharacterized protein n=1 Tax=Panulirus ornatus TaxID=150431 RepID=UPI003A880276